jgi:hypothetical protein
MKVYVTGYQLKELPTHQEDIEVGYSKDPPEWRTVSVYEADARRIFLQDKRVQVDGHRCQFSVEELPEGQFAIVCLSHPDGSVWK